MHPEDATCRWPVIAAVLLLTDAAVANEDANSAGILPACKAAYCSKFEPVRRQIERAVEHGESVSLAVAVAVDGAIVWEEGFGWADRERRIPATAATIYPIASVSKPITATGLMILVERGKVSLDQPIDEYLGSTRIHGYAGDAKGATVRRILQHRAGLPRYVQFFFAGEGTAPPSVEQTIDRYGILINPPGTTYDYSNLGFGMLAYITARVAERDYAEFMRDEVFVPLGLTRTSVQIRPEPSVDAAVSYADGSRIPYYRFDEWGSGRVFSTVHDLASFGLFHLKAPRPGARKVLSDRAVDAMVNDRESSGTAGGRYGLDWFYALGWGGRERTAFGPYWYGHDGGMPGVSSAMKLLPDHRLVVVAVSNSRSGVPAQIVDSVIDTLLPQYRAARLTDPALKDGAAKPFAPPAELVGTWKGEVRTWQGRLDAQLRILGDARAYLRVGEEPEVPVEGVRFDDDGRLSGDAAGTMPTIDIRSRPHHREIRLTLRNGRLTGSISVTGESPLIYFDLPSWITLSRL